MSREVPAKPSVADYTLAWTPGTDKVALFPHPGPVPNEYVCTGLAAYMSIKKATPAQRKAAVFIEAYHLIVADGCDPAAVHRALWPLREYRDGLAEDFPAPGKPLRWSRVKFDTRPGYR